MCSAEYNSSVNCINNSDTITSERKKSTNDMFHLSPSPSAFSLPKPSSPCRSVDGGQCNDDDIEEIGYMFETKSASIEKWLKEKASPETLAKIHALTDLSRLPKSPKRQSVTSDLFQQWLASSPIMVRIVSCRLFFNLFSEILSSFIYSFQFHLYSIGK